MSEEQTRAEFEAWWANFQSEYEEWKYADTEALLFQAWQAALSAKSVPVGFCVNTEGADGLVVMSQYVAGQLICIRDLLVSKDYEEAYHVLYSLADPDFTSLTPWQKLEDIAKGVGCPQPDERVRELEKAVWVLKQIANLDPKNSGLIGTAVFMAKEAIASMSSGEQR